MFGSSKMVTAGTVACISGKRGPASSRAMALRKCATREITAIISQKVNQPTGNVEREKSHQPHDKQNNKQP
jgi:hypothetical protein